MTRLENAHLFGGVTGLPENLTNQFCDKTRAELGLAPKPKSQQKQKPVQGDFAVLTRGFFPIAVRVLAQAEGYAMVVRKGRHLPFIVNTRDLKAKQGGQQ